MAQTQGVSQFSMEGTQYNVVGNLTWNLGGSTGSPQVSLQGVEYDVISYTPIVATIAVTVRWIAGTPPSTIGNGSVVNTIMARTRNGIQITATNCRVTDQITQNPVELTTTYNFACGNIHEEYVGS